MQQVAFSAGNNVQYGAATRVLCATAPEDVWYQPRSKKFVIYDALWLMGKRNNAIENEKWKIKNKNKKWKKNEKKMKKKMKKKEKKI